MRTAFLLAAIMPAFAAAQPAVEVRLGDPEKFTDFRTSPAPGPAERAGLAEELRRHVERSAGMRLARGMRLAVTITDVDMAGEYGQGSHTGNRDVRVVKPVFPPRVDLEFRLSRPDGSVALEGRRTLTDRDFLLSAGSQPRDPLVFEKALIDRWLRRELAAAR